MSFWLMTGNAGWLMSLPRQFVATYGWPAVAVLIGGAALAWRAVEASRRRLDDGRAAKWKTFAPFILALGFLVMGIYSWRAANPSATKPSADEMQAAIQEQEEEIAEARAEQKWRENASVIARMKRLKHGWQRWNGYIPRRY
jgi:thiol:disulfide interchange protein